MNAVLLIAVLLRSGKLHDLHRQLRGGPAAARNSTTSIDRGQIALGQFDLGKRGISLVYKFVIMIVCWIFYTVMTMPGPSVREEGARDEPIPGRRIIMVTFLFFLLLPIYWLVTELQTNTNRHT